MKSAIIIALLLTLSGCVTPVTPEQISQAEYGTVPTNYKELIQNFMYNILLDPESGRYRYFGEPVKGYAHVKGSMQPPEFGYLVTVGVNAKNRMGGYVGEKIYVFLFRGQSHWMLSEYTNRQTIS